MKLVVGLGNPGKKYEATRHNIGFDVLNHFSQLHGATGRTKKFEGEIAQVQVVGMSVLLLWPHTFMNLSGASVRKAADFYKVASRDILVVCDDFNLPLAKLRFRPQGSSGGQKGLADILRQVGVDQIARLRVGVGPVPEQWDPAAFVLGRFNKAEQDEILPAIRKASDGIATWIDQGIDACMNRYNG
ncbi:MAG: aminoacyl-tRNA hydrolase [Planctomycetales bacterium]|nr:aminoacyl-tRNA hydrolase [Planctomycetales bacterium]